MTKAKRHEYTLLTITAYLVGAALYTALGVYSLLMGAYANEAFIPTLVLGWTVLGGYLFFSMVSGLLFTARWLSSMRLKWKLLMMVFFVIPVHLVMLGILYSIPYGVYNYIAYRKAVEDEQER